MAAVREFIKNKSYYFIHDLIYVGIMLKMILLKKPESLQQTIKNLNLLVITKAEDIMRIASKNYAFGFPKLCKRIAQIMRYNANASLGLNLKY